MKKLNKKLLKVIWLLSFLIPLSRFSLLANIPCSSTDPALVSPFFTQGTSVNPQLNANTLEFGQNLNLFVPFYNGNQLNAIEAGALKITINLGTKYNLTSPTTHSNYFNWSVSGGMGSDLIIVGDNVGKDPLPADYFGNLEFEIQSIFDCNDNISAKIEIISGSTVCDEDLTNNEVTLQYNIIPTVESGKYGPVCEESPDITLEGIPAGGVWSGVGVSGSIASGFVFDPNSGTQTLTYTITSANGCTNSAQTTITVIDDTTAPVISGCPVEDPDDNDPDTLPVINAIASANCSALVTLPTITFSDNCTPNANIIIAWEIFLPLPATPVTGTGPLTTYNFPVGTSEVQITYQDASGNSADCNFKVVVSKITPTFTQVNPICAGSVLNPLPTTSNNGVVGTWAPAMDNTTTTEYTFTPTAGQCANTATMEIVVNQPVDPTFMQVPAICKGETLAALPTSSTNMPTAITGTWDPVINNMATTTYTFTPTAGQCANTATMEIVVNQPVDPTFMQVPAICKGETLAALPTSSTNMPTAITGTWDPVINNMATTTYTFTPTAGQCANSATMEIVVNQPVDPTFMQVPAICKGETLVALPTSSTNMPTAITGTWDPVINNMATTTYTFTPTAGQCANTATMEIVVNQPVDPTFTQVPPICVGNNLTALPLTSNNGITGTWSPALDNTATTTYTFTPTAGLCAIGTTMEIVVNPAAVNTISGRVLEDPNSGSIDGTPLTVPNTYISLFKSTNLTATPDMVAPVTMGTGIFSFAGLADDKYKLVIGTSPMGSNVSSFPNVGLFSMQASAEGLSGGTGDGLDDGITFVTFNCGAISVSSAKVQAAGLIDFAIEQKGPLPVRLISFNGKPNEKGNELTWKTSSEQNFSHYEIERSVDAQSFKQIGRVNGAKGNNKETLSYTFLDENKQSGMVPGAASTSISNLTAYYRLKMIDLDGSSEYSKVIFIKAENEPSIVGEFYPNPAFGNEVSIKVTNASASNWTITTYDLSGRVINTETRLLDKGENKVKIDLKENKSGISIFRFENADGVQYRKLNR